MFISGCRAEGNEAAIVLLPSNITVFTLDFSGSGLSHGDFVSLGWNEVSFFRISSLGDILQYSFSWMCVNPHDLAAAFSRKMI